MGDYQPGALSPVELPLLLNASSSTNLRGDRKVCSWGQNARLTGAHLFPCCGFLFLLLSDVVPVCNYTSMSAFLQQNIFGFDCRADVCCNIFNSLDDITNVKKMTLALAMCLTSCEPSECGECTFPGWVRRRRHRIFLVPVSTCSLWFGSVPGLLGHNCSVRL